MLPQNFLQIALLELEKRYPQGAVYDFLVDKNTQKTEIESLKKTTKYEQFFFVINLPERKVEYAYGLAEWLGYADASFTLFDYFRIIHPRHLTALNMSAQSAFETANSDAFNLKFMGQRIVIQIPLLHANGKYLLCKRTLYPFQIDKKTGIVTSYLNHYVVLKEYQDLDALDLRVGNETQLNTNAENKALKQNQKVLLDTTNKPFSFNTKEIKILELIAQKPDITQKEICEELKIRLETLQKTTNRRILAKAREHFDIEAFSSIKEVALYLKKEGILG
ncbi:winged helix-turn-helix domain-containing protein [Lacihabitans sp. LS3-19]|uniref:winged helix-turn-helix domain-containing protein n=1 Tax=Lacihabitans sp. LS3-19 TaxID=2487335 RepID=UPI0020CD62FE|nr:winged helix-turn-helix domain-containing protein [Lacihabitans sp. LS3-19]MCP9770315.1 winged helix-turn-helix domain-containing protein [Lacihabitans sp. LS3-19]